MKVIPPLFVLLALLRPLAASAADLEIYQVRGQTAVRSADAAAEKSFPVPADAFDYALSLVEKEGGAVEVHRGHYALARGITVPSNVTLRGSGRATRLELEPAAKFGVMVSGKGTNIEDLAIFGAPEQSGVIMDAAGDCHLKGLLVQGFGYGIWVRNSSFLISVVDCSAADNSLAGYYFDSLRNGRGGDFIPNLVSNCFAYGGGNGFEANHAIVLNFVGCVAHQPRGHGFYFHDGSFSISVTGCRTFQVGKDGLREERSGEINVSSNIFCWSRGNGIVINNVQWGTIAANNVIDVGVRTTDGSYRDGIKLENKSNGIHVTGNAIFNYGDQCPMQNGITVDATCTNLNLVANNINYFVGKGIDSKGQNITIANNIEYGEHSYKNEGRPPYPDFDDLRLNRFLKQ
ncbi:MAG: right-handed parallel beta-helix repeat-containing protein [Lacunisphaera sp.]